MSDHTSEPENNDNAGVKIPPPLCFLFFLVVGILVSSDWIDGTLGPLSRLVIGGIPACIGLFFIISEAKSHKKSGSNVEPWKPTTTIIDTGLYAYSRNPIYVGMTITYVSISFAAFSLGALLLLPFCLLIIHYFVIAKEEAYLEDKFGDEYLSYKSRVRRWF
ncbi:MAG: isoprenylcysteine carboxylmethyltransferase family protein [Sneathiella sp.]|nr:isoprenylcysteine carboxylmethyltransferase family protein [Sneathiella sp.]